MTTHLKTLFTTEDDRALALEALTDTLDKYENRGSWTQFMCVNLTDWIFLNEDARHSVGFALRSEIEHERLGGDIMNRVVAYRLGQEEDASEEETKPHRIAFLKELIAELQ